MILRHLVFEKNLQVGFLLFGVVVDNMVLGFHFAFELNNNFVCFLGFVIKIFYCMTFGYVLFVGFVCFVYMVQKIWLLKRSG